MLLTKVVNISNAEESFSIYNFCKDFGPWIFSVATLYYSYRVIVKEQREKRLSFIIEVNKLLMEDPNLWLIYDSHYLHINRRSIPYELEGKLDAFCYFILNNLEVAWGSTSIFSSKRTAWRNYFIGLVSSSTRFRRIVNDAIKRKIYSEQFISFLRDNTL